MQVEETTQSPLRPTRAGFVRALPLTMPVEEVIERGREVGLELQPSDIHAARYYMRQVAAADGASIPQQLLLGGTFVTKPLPTTKLKRNGSNGSPSTNGITAAPNNTANAAAVEKTGVVAKTVSDDDDDFEEEQAPAVAAPKRRKIVQSKAMQQLSIAAKDSSNGKAKAAKDSATNGAPLHDRIQARLANATFRETERTARDERKAAREERQTARQTAQQAREAARQTAREEREERQNERQTERLSARAKQERQARQERLEKATIGKALLDADSIKSRNKRAAQSTSALEEQARLIALRLGTQRVRELLDAMETLARQA